jgi:hypothetical protein
MHLIPPWPRLSIVDGRTDWTVGTVDEIEVDRVTSMLEAGLSIATSPRRPACTARACAGSSEGWRGGVRLADFRGVHVTLSFFCSVTTWGDDA